MSMLNEEQSYLLARRLTVDRSGYGVEHTRQEILLLPDCDQVELWEEYLKIPIKEV